MRLPAPRVGVYLIGGVVRESTWLCLPAAHEMRRVDTGVSHTAWHPTQKRACLSESVRLSRGSGGGGAHDPLPP